MTDKRVIAIIDDDELVRLSVSSLVRSYGYETLAYGSALEFLADVGSPDPACIVSDVQMPLMTGDQLQESMISSGRRLPMIFMTAYPVKALEEKLMAGGAISCLTKPADDEEIIRSIQRALGLADDVTG